MIIHNCEQRSEEWYSIRRGKFTSSRFPILMGKKINKGYNDELYKIAYERISNENIDEYINKYVQNGIEQEPNARLTYETERNIFVEQIGFIELNEWVGSSPDGLIDNDGSIEIKCVKYNTQIDRLLSQEFPSEYWWQVQGQLWIAERQWCDFISYNPNLPLFIKRIYRDGEAINNLEIRLNECIKEVRQIINKIDMIKKNESAK